MVASCDPPAKFPTGLFSGDSHQVRAVELVLGSNDPKDIEVRSLALKDALHPFRWEPAKRKTSD